MSKTIARRMRSAGLTYTEIARKLEISKSTARRWGDPAAEAEDARIRNDWKRRNRERKRQYDREYSLKRNYPDFKPPMVRACRCEKPWPQDEDGYTDPRTGASLTGYISCLKCSREIT